MLAQELERVGLAMSIVKKAAVLDKREQLNKSKKLPTQKAQEWASFPGKNALL